MSAPFQDAGKNSTPEGPAAGRILLIDDDPDYCALFERFVTSGSSGRLAVHATHSAAGGLTAARSNTFDAVCLDLGLPDADGLLVLRDLRALDQHLPVVVISADTTVERVVMAMNEGAFDYQMKGADRGRLVSALSAAVERRREETRVVALQQSTQNMRWGIVGATPEMRSLFAQIERVAPNDVTVSVLGESGSGKELVARALHEASPRHPGPFVAINCAAIPETLQEAELFGHEKGAFTGALTRRVGRLEQAHGGTLFLDEVAELSPALQAKLLRCIQERRFTRVGGTQEIETDFRLVTATHKDLAQEVAAGRFREDLYFRLVVFELRVPPLRERRDDIPVLVHHFLSIFPDREGRTLSLAPDALDAFMQATWRGNVRELQNAIQHAAVVARHGIIRREDLPPRLRGFVNATLLPGPASFSEAQPAAADGTAVRVSTLPTAARSEPIDDGSDWIDETTGWASDRAELESTERYQRAPSSRSASRSGPRGAPRSVATLPPVELPLPVHRVAAPSSLLPSAPAVSVQLPAMRLDELERLAILQAIERNQGNISAAIRELGLGRTTLYRKLQQYGIR